jgi:hypothetical protein
VTDTSANSEGRRQNKKFRHTIRELRRVGRTGALVGVLLSSILTAWLLVANRVPSLERFAGFRNAIAVALLLLAAAIPVVRFRNSAKEIFPAGVIALTIATICYYGWTIYFEELSDRMSPIQIFVLGTASYGLASAILWMTSLVRSARHHHQITMQPAARRRP